MALSQIDIGIRHRQGSLLEEVQYYWTHVYYMDSDDFPSTLEMFYSVQSVEYFAHTSFCSMQLSQLKQPPGRGNVIEVFENNFLEGAIIPDDQLSYLGQVGMVVFFDGENRRHRKWFRQPLRRVDIDGDMLSSTGIANITYYADLVLAAGVFRTLHGGLLERYQISPRIHNWQLRHGTKRRMEPLLRQGV